MKIRLIDVDSHNFPNLPLMKISSWHKQQGHDVEFYEPLIDLRKGIDKIYMSKIYDFTIDYFSPLYAREVIQGGTGYSLSDNLPTEIENQYPDYGLYNIKNTAYGFLSRGCPKNCDFCIVSKKEGYKSKKVADLSGFWRGQKEIKLLDPNLLACKDAEGLLNQLIESKAYIDFTQGLDIRLLNENTTDLIMKCKIKMLHFAWDKEQDSQLITRKLREFKKQTKVNDRKARVYILTNFDTTFDFDLFRVYETRNLGFDPYIMIFNKEKADKKYKDLQRFVNNKFIFHSDKYSKFEDYKR